MVLAFQGNTTVLANPRHSALPDTGCLLPWSIHTLPGMLETGRKARWILWFDPVQLFLLLTTEAQQIGTTGDDPSDKESPDSRYL